MDHRSFGRRSLLALLVAAPSLLACSKPEPPRITPKELKLVSISATGIEVRVRLAVENPNRIDLDARAVDATLTFDDGLEIGKTKAGGVHLPAGQTVDLQVPMALRWKDLSALAPYALRETVPFTVKGDVQIGGALALRVPFTIRGALTRADLAKLAMSAIPGLPGIK